MRREDRRFFYLRGYIQRLHKRVIALEGADEDDIEESSEFRERQDKYIRNLMRENISLREQLKIAKESLDIRDKSLKLRREYHRLTVDRNLELLREIDMLRGGTKKPVEKTRYYFKNEGSEVHHLVASTHLNVPASGVCGVRCLETEPILTSRLMSYDRTCKNCEKVHNAV